MIKCNCSYCGKTIYKKPCYLKNNKKVFCSHKCYSKNLIGNKRPFEICKAISEHHARHNLGKKMSSEIKAKISKSKKGKKLSAKHKQKIKANTPRGNKHPNWKGGKYINTQGYVMVHAPNHPFKDCRNKVREHRLIAETVFNRYLTPIEKIHHIDGNLQNNNPSNLYLFKTQGEHNKFHRRSKGDSNLILKSNII